MTSFRFLHCSDLHIDSPFKGLARVRPELALRLREAGYQAFQNIVALAISEEVDAVVIAGDIYDSADKSLQAQFKFHRGLQQLSDAGIPTFVAHGNHDPLDSWSASLEWPANVHIFSGREPQCMPVIRNGRELAHIHGVSFPRRDIRDNLSLQFNVKNADVISIAVLHANVGADSQHENYAPCTLQDLASKPFDYWALGHVHAHRILRPEQPAVVYPGNVQARQFREAGPRGCCIVNLTRHTPPQIAFVPIDAVRFMEDRLDLSGATTLNDAISQAQRRCVDLAKQSEGRESVIRLHLVGRTEIDGDLRKPQGREDLQAEIQSFLDSQSPPIWVDIQIETAGAYDIETYRNGSSFISDVLALYDQTLSEPDREELMALLKPLFEDWPGRNSLDEISEDELRELLLHARDLTLNQLIPQD